jgi:uncharacterized protein (DUF4213/DUF364 family)
MVSSTIEELLERGMGLARELLVTDLRVGLGYTAVEVSGKDVGLAYTFRHDIGGTCTALKQAGQIAGRTAKELIEWMRRDDLLSSAIGLATLNALLQPHLPEGVGEDFLPLLKLGPGDKVGMVGFFAPLIQPIRRRCGDLLIFESKKNREKGLLGPEEIAFRIPDCTVVILSATTLINKTFDEIVKYIEQAREVVLLGPSAPLLPDAFEGTPVTYLGGVEMIDKEKSFRIISEGGGTQRLMKSGSVRKIVVPSKR